jgi:hypothetical protein
MMVKTRKTAEDEYNGGADGEDEADGDGNGKKH